ncbi:MAG: carbohydrate ABC transporter permease [bacterium]|nr:carbohydrate ABC transporter permease [bacterium]
MRGKSLIYAFLLMGAILSSFPFVWMVSTSLKSHEESISQDLRILPSEWHWENVGKTFEAAPFGTYFYNTFAVAFSVTVGVVLTSILAGYAFARLSFPGKNVLFAVMLATMMVPFEVALIPNFVFIKGLGWYNSYAALIVPWCANAFSVFLMRQAFLALPSDFFEAARVDGCGHLRYLAWVAAPLVKPMAVTVALFAFLGSYNSLLWPLIVTSRDDMRVVQVGLTMFTSDEVVQFNLLMCASTFVILPTVALYFAAQRHFLESSLSGGIKG